MFFYQNQQVTLAHQGVVQVQFVELILMRTVVVQIFTLSQGNIQTYVVDGNGFNSSESDWMGNHTTYERNIQNQVLQMTDPMGNSTTYGYDERGNMTVTTDCLLYTSRCV